MQLVGSGLRCVRGGREVFGDIAFEVQAGEALRVTGPNGAGKSSLLRIIAALLRPAAGTVVLADGHPDLTLAEQAHYLGHLDPLKPSLTVAENLDFWAGLLATRDNVTSSLTTMGLAELAGLPALYLSAGQRRRLSIARLVAVRRPIWLLDEPTTSLDEESRTRFAGLMRDHLATGGLIVAATHGTMGLDGTRELRLSEPGKR